ncbi:MAG: RidA family protein [Bacteroidetes bacterium]|nr:RidA family protein [Bacteroidota bacterium]
MTRTNFSSGAPWESIVGYSRAVQIGNQLEVTGTVAIGEDGKVVGKGNPYEQTRFIINKAEKILVSAGFTLSDVIRTRIFVTDIAFWKEVGKAHGESFSAIRPATTMVQVVALIEPEYLVEIEFTAIRENS